MRIFIKLGGSLITDKTVESSFRADVMQTLSQQIATALKADPSLELLIGHGSGSFGHFAAKQHGTMDSVKSPQQWRGFAEVATVAAELNYLVAQSLHQAGIPVWRLQPSASSLAHDGVIVDMAVHPIKAALAKGLVPLVYGDVALDDVRGGTITSTEAVLTYLVKQIPVDQILLIGEVEGVYDAAGRVIPEITPSNIKDYEHVLGASGGTDVTGGMLTKVQDMVALVTDKPYLKIRIMNSTLLKEALLAQAQPGTLIYSA